MYTGNQYDMKVWFNTGKWLNSGTNIYLPNDHLGYPPLWAFWCLVAYNVYGFFGGNMEAWRLAIKVPMILAQFAMTYAVWKFAQSRFDAQTAKKLAFYTLTCSFFIYISVLWGQINLLSVLFTFLSFYAVVTKRLGWGALLLGIAVTLKIYPLLALPALLIYIFKNHNFKETTKFAAITVAVPAVFTTGVFAAYGWDLLYFLKTIFYWAPVYDANPVQFGGGCMNLWSFAGLLGLDIAEVAVLRFLWIPILAALAIYWVRKKAMTTADLSLALISFYFLFMISYSWVSEQTFLDTLPFLFLQIVAFQPKRDYLYGLIGVQVLVYAFSFFNGGTAIFQPLFEMFYPAAVAPAQQLGAATSTLSWVVRGCLGLAVSVALAAYLAWLAKPAAFEKRKEQIQRLIHR